MSETHDPPLNGVVEGFYGRPWTPAQRLQLFGWLRDAELKAYLYAPKDDLKHRALWRELYEPAEASDLQRLIEQCAAHGLEFIYALAPGLDITAANESDVAALMAKLEQVHRLGARHAAVLWDDIPAQLVEADRKAFGTPAAAQCAVTNRVYEAVRQRNGRLLFCPTVYCGRMAEPTVRESAYLQEVGAKLAPGVEFLWTGPEIISESIPIESIRELRGVIRRKPVLWDNLHANDYDMRRLYLGPYSGRPAALRDEINGVLLNPNGQFPVNYVPIHTLGAYLRPSTPPNPREAYRLAVTAWLPRLAGRGRTSLTFEEVELLGDLLYLPCDFGDRAQRYLEDFVRLLRTPPAGWGEAQVRFEQTTRQIVTIYDKLTELRDRDLLYSLYPHVWELKETALLLLAWVDWRRQHPEPGARFRSRDFRPRVYRGGFVASLERLLPMDDEGWFNPAA